VPSISAFKSSTAPQVARFTVWRADCTTSGVGSRKTKNSKETQDHGKKDSEKGKEARIREAAHSISRAIGLGPSKVSSCTTKGCRPRNGSPFFMAGCGFQTVKRGYLYQNCERIQRHVACPACQAKEWRGPEIFALPVIPSRRDPSGLGISISTATKFANSCPKRVSLSVLSLIHI